MKRIVSKNNYVELHDFNGRTGEYIMQLGFPLSGLTYKIDNGNVKFYLKEDYFYKNSVWSADIPLLINGVTYTADTVSDGLAVLFASSGGGGVSGVSSVNGKSGVVTLTASDVDAYSKSESNDLLQDIEDQIQLIEDDIETLETELNGHAEELDNIDVQLQTIDGKIQEIEDDIDALESDNTTNKADIATLKDDVNALKSRVTALETAAQNYLVASNIKSGTNIAVSVSGKDVTISTVGIPTVEGLAELEEQVSANTTAIEGIQQEITEKEHFRGYFNTNAEIQALTASNGDFAYSAQSGTKWVYNGNAWADTHTSVPDKTVEKSTTVPLMDGTAAIGSSNRYAAADHIHPTDTTRASQSDLAALDTQVQANTTSITNKADKSDTYTKIEINNLVEDALDVLTTHTSNTDIHVTTADKTAWNNKSDFSGSYNDLTDKPTIPDVSDYYTKTESDNRFALKFTDVDDIQKVSSLPSNPDSRTLYLIPV